MSKDWISLCCHSAPQHALAYQDRGQGHKYIVSLHEWVKLIVYHRRDIASIHHSYSGDFPRHNYLIELPSSQHSHIFRAGSNICHAQTFQGEIAKWLCAVPLTKRPWMNHKNSSALLCNSLINHLTKPFPNRCPLFLWPCSLEERGFQCYSVYSYVVLLNIFHTFDQGRVHLRL